MGAKPKRRNAQLRRIRTRHESNQLLGPASPPLPACNKPRRQNIPGFPSSRITSTHTLIKVNIRAMQPYVSE